MSVAVYDYASQEFLIENDRCAVCLRFVASKVCFVSVFPCSFWPDALFTFTFALFADFVARFMRSGRAHLALNCL